MFITKNVAAPPDVPPWHGCHRWRCRCSNAMVPALDRDGQDGGQCPRNASAAIYVPHGVIMEQWMPTTAGADFEFMPIMKPLEPFRKSLVVVSNLARPERGVNTNHAGAAVVPGSRA